MRQVVRGALFGLAALALGAGAAGAVTCALDPVPAATLLLPYFEVDLAHADGRTTLFAVANSAAAPVLAHVVLWTDLAVPTLAFDVFLTGYDVQTLNLRDLFDGVLPRTADAARDPDNDISPRGELSGDSTFPDCADLLPPPPPPPAVVADLRLAHLGLPAATGAGLCSGIDHGDGVARGYVTVDVARRCSLARPGDEGYFGPDGVAADDNVLWGDFFSVDPAGNFAQGENLVRIESAPAARLPGDPTFYARFTGATAADAREPLSAVWAARNVAGAAFDGGTELVVWRDARGASASFPCGTRPSWYPLSQRQIVTFDEEENVAVLSGEPLPITPPPPPPMLPAATARTSVDDLPVPFPFEFGWAYLNLRDDSVANANPPQAWVGTVISAEGRYAVGYAGTPLENGCGPDGGGILP